MRSDLLNRKGPISIGALDNPLDNHLTIAPAEYEKVRKPINKTRKNNMPLDTCPVPDAAKGKRSSMPKDKGGAAGGALLAPAQAE
jgi:hypothetical protein